MEISGRRADNHVGVYPALDVRIWRLKTVPVLKELKTLKWLYT